MSIESFDHVRTFNVWARFSDWGAVAFTDESGQDPRHTLFDCVPIDCPTCRGSGYASGHRHYARCVTCQGAGEVVVWYGGYLAIDGRGRYA